MAPICSLATKLGIHPVHLGVLMIVNTESDLHRCWAHLYIASSIAKMGISEIDDRSAAVAVRDAGLPRLIT